MPKASGKDAELSYIRYLVLSGFKSFRDWNLVELSPQVTVVVGGNGTGKSSLVEALLWTLGEDDGGSLRVNEPRELLFRPPSARLPGQVRSETEQHILFTHRLAEREAEEAACRQELEARAQEAVAYMVLGDESACDCDADADEEDGCCCKPSGQESREVPEGLITVKRHLDREGLATYELDGAPAMQTRVQAALSEHGISRELVSVIRQGELERVLLADPELRAQILAEAAGAEDPERSDKIPLLQLEAGRLTAYGQELDRRLAELRPAQAAPRDGNGSSALRLRLLERVLTAWDDEAPLPLGRPELYELLGLDGVCSAEAASGDRFSIDDLVIEIGRRRGAEEADAQMRARRAGLEGEKAAVEARLAGVQSRLAEVRAQVAERDSASRDALGAAHGRVQARFSRFFQMLVPGGDVQLGLRLPSNSEPAAVDLAVTFPDCAPERVEALSGGQRALVAFSLGLAFFLEAPSRLLVLDEVEPALDESNLRRFNDLLHEVAQTRQVVVVSHQRRTKDVGDVVFGVDMAGEGASMIHYRFEPATKRLILFGRVRGNWLERSAAHEAEEKRVLGVSSSGAEGGAGCC